MSENFLCHLLENTTRFETIKAISTVIPIKNNKNFASYIPAVFDSVIIILTHASFLRKRHPFLKFLKLGASKINGGRKFSDIILENHEFICS